MSTTPKVTTKRYQTMLMREVRATLAAASFQAARYSDGGYMRKSRGTGTKSGSHRAGYRVEPSSNTAQCIVRYEVREFVPYSMLVNGDTDKARESASERYQRWRQVLEKYQAALVAAGFTASVADSETELPRLFVWRP